MEIIENLIGEIIKFPEENQAIEYIKKIRDDIYSEFKRNYPYFNYERFNSLDKIDYKGQLLIAQLFALEVFQSSLDDTVPSLILENYIFDPNLIDPKSIKIDNKANWVEWKNKVRLKYRIVLGNK